MKAKSKRSVFMVSGLYRADFGRWRLWWGSEIGGNSSLCVAIPLGLIPRKFPEEGAVKAEPAAYPRRRFCLHNAGPLPPALRYAPSSASAPI